MGNWRPAPFRAFAEEEFYPTASWARLDKILAGNGGAYGLHGPRGSGKSWLMRRAICRADENGGMGLWFPCPRDDDSAAFLSALSDNLASAVERRFIRHDAWLLAVGRLRLPLIALVAAPIIVTAVTSLAHGRDVNTFIAAVPAWLWAWIGAGTGLLLAIAVGGVIRDNRLTGRLAREATALRERIRFTTALKHGSELNVSGGTPLAGAFRRTRERSLDERPTTVASLVFDFRNLAELIAKALGGPLVIGIDELDKADDPGTAHGLLRDIKAIFEIPGVFFLVSVSDEASAALALGSLRASGRDEFNSSFYTVLEIPPLCPAETADMLRRKGAPAGPQTAQLLCLLGAGNWRETLRLAEQAGIGADREATDPADMAASLLLGALRVEAAALMREVVTVASDADSVIGWAWRALPDNAFGSPQDLMELSRVALHDCWRGPAGLTAWEKWASVEESWRRFLIRLFVTERTLDSQVTGESAPEWQDVDICDLRDVLIMSGRSAAIARLMLQARFGDGLSGPYRRSGELGLVPGAGL
ncbi:MAG: P-loop NTPase fold protein [Trebonia sp.]